MDSCPHRNVQQFTECCLDCGHNIYETDKERYLKRLEELARQKRLKEDSEIDRKIKVLERELGISHFDAGDPHYDI